MRRRIVRWPRAGTLIAAMFVAVVLAATQTLVAGAQTAVTVAVTSSLNPSTYGQTTTFTATVSGLGGLLGQGTVQFQVDGANVGNAQTVGLGGVATYSTSSLTGGSHTVSAKYTSGTGNGSGSLAGGQVVNKAATTLKLSSSANPAGAGSPIILTATIAVTSPGSGVPDGSVSFVSGKLSLGSIAISGGQAYLTVSPDTLPGGTDSITASYPGSGNYAASSATLSQVVAGSGAGATPTPGPSSSTKPTPTPTKSPSPKPTPTPSKTPKPTPTPSASPTLVVPTPSFTFEVPTPTFPTSFPLAESPTPSTSSSPKSSKLPLVALIVIILVVIAAMLIVRRRRRIGM